MSGGGHGKRRAKHEEHEEHVNHERWLVSYADMLTVLMALFIVLFALSQVDAVKFAQFKAGLTDGGAASNVVMPGDDGINQVDNGEDPIDLLPLAGGDPMQQMSAQDVLDQAQKEATQSDLDAARAEVAQYRDVEEQLDRALTAQGKENQVTYRITSEGLVIGLVADNVFFANGSADIQPAGLQVLDVVGPTLAGLPNEIAVQGHTNSLPLSSTERYRDNWDLSTSRANSVLTHFIGANRISDQRLSSTGFGSARPLYPDTDPKALTGNRRVDLVVASPSSESVKALLPQVAAGTPTEGPAEVRAPDPVSSEPVAADRAVADPGITQPISTTDLSTTDLSTTDPSTTDDSTTENAAGQASAGTAVTPPEGH